VIEVSFKKDDMHYRVHDFDIGEVHCIWTLALPRACVGKTFSLGELISFFKLRLARAILLISGYVPLANRRMYWESAEDVHNEAISSAMPVNRGVAAIYSRIVITLILIKGTSSPNFVHYL
jgi:hypothetical protein